MAHSDSQINENFQVRPRWLAPWLIQWSQGMVAQEFTFADLAQNTAVSGQAATQKNIHRMLSNSFSNVKINLQQIDLAKEKLTLRLTFKGCHTGTFAGIPPTKRLVQLPSTLICYLENGRIHHISLNYDAAELLKQLGFALQ